MRQSPHIVALLALCAAASAGDGPCLDWEPVVSSNMPPARYGAAMVYDAARDVVLLYGGSVSNQQLLGDLWQWDGEDWSQIAMPEPNPGLRTGARMLFNEIDGKVYFYGGMVRGTLGGFFTIPEMWSWDGQAWTLEWSGSGTQNPPRGRANATFVFDTLRQRTIVHGGVFWQGDAIGIMRDLVESNGVTWSVIDSGGGVGPGYVSATTAWFDPQAGDMKLFGTSNFANPLGHAFWSWNGTAWSPLPGATPPVRAGSMFGYDAPNNRLILAGGGTFSDVWLWDGATWTELNTSPTPIRGAASCMDGDGRLITFGGYNSVGNPPPPINEMWRLAPAPLLGDIDGDAHVGMSDLMFVVDDINTSGDDQPGDINSDGVVSFADLNIVVSNYNQSCP